MARFCTKCGNQLTETAVYCPACGAKVDYNPETDDAKKADLPVINKRKSKSPLILISIFLVLAAIISTAAIFLTRPTPGKTINKFVKCYNSLDADGMLECLEPSAQEVYKGLTALFTGLTGYDANDIFQGVLGFMNYSDDTSRPQVNMKIINVDYTSKTEAVVKVKCSYFNGQETSNTTESIAMVKIAGKWYISLLEDFYNYSPDNIENAEDASAEQDDTSANEEDIYESTENASSATIQTGDYVQFGSYNGEPILWKCVDKNNGTMLVSYYVLTVKPYDAAESGTYISRDENNSGSNVWSNSNLREWLNSKDQQVSYTTQPPCEGAVECNAYEDESGFLYNFSEEERNLLQEVYHDDAYDLVYLLSKEEASTYSKDLLIRPTAAAIERDEEGGFDNYSFWTRTPCNDTSNVWLQFSDFTVYTGYSAAANRGVPFNGYGQGGVLPAITLNSDVYITGSGEPEDPFVLCEPNTYNANASDISQDVPSQQEFVIGGIGPMTGSAGIYGQSVMNGAELAIKEINESGGINGFQVNFVSEDDEADAEMSINALNTLIDNGMQILMGTVTSSACEAVAGRTKEAGIFQLTPTASAEFLLGYENLFQVCYTDPNQGAAAAQYIVSKGLANKVAVIYDYSDVYSSGICDRFIQEARNLNLDIVSAESFAYGETDFAVQINNTINAGAELVFLPVYYNEASQILTQAAALNYYPIYFGCDGLDGILGVESFDKSLAEGLMILTPFAPDASDTKTINFVKAYSDTYGNTPNQFAAGGYDAIYIIKAAIEMSGVTPDMDTVTIGNYLKEAMTSISYDGLTGAGMRWDNNGAVYKTPKAIIIQNGQYVSVE